MSALCLQFAALPPCGQEPINSGLKFLIGVFIYENYTDSGLCIKQTEYNEEFLKPQTFTSRSPSSHRDPLSSLLTYQRLGKTQQAYVALLSEYVSKKTLNYGAL